MYYTNYSGYFSNERPRAFDFKTLKAMAENRQPKDIIAGEVIEGAPKQLQEWVLDMWVYNEMEQNINCYFHEALIDRYLMMCGYKKSAEEIRNKNVLDFLDDYDEYPYNEIDDIRYEESEEAYRKIVCGEATTTDKLQYIKYDFNNGVLFDYHKIPLLLRMDMFETYLRHKDPILKRLLNIQHEMGDKEAEHISLYQDNIDQKKASITEMKAVFGIERSFDVASIPREKLKEMGEYIKQNKSQLCKIWGLELPKSNQKDLSDKAVIGCVCQVFGLWCGSEFKMGERERKQVNGKRTDVSAFNLKPLEYIEPFVDNHKSRFEGTSRIMSAWDDDEDDALENGVN